MKHRPERKWRPAMPGRITSNEFRVPARLLVDPVQSGVDQLSGNVLTVIPTNHQPQHLPT